MTGSWEDENLTNFNKEGFDKFLRWCFENDVSDILIETGEVLAVKKFGEVTDVGSKILRYDEITGILGEIYQPASASLLKSGEELNFKYLVCKEDDSVIRFRVNATSCQGSEGSDDGIEIVVRPIPGTVPDCDDLDIEEEIRKACSAQYGIILITGPTGSGKSTTIAALLKMIGVKYRRHIVTFESPIEFDLKSIPNRKSRIVQSEVPINLGSFSAATVNSLRRAPDIIFFGEARDAEVISACIREAQTGHLVLSTVHTNSVAMTPSRMVDEFDPAERKGATSKLVDALRLIVHQRLYPKMGGGRIAIREFLIFTEEMRRKLLFALLTKDDLGSEIEKLVKENGKPLLSDAKKKFREGCIDLSTYITIVNEVGDKDKDLKIVPEVAKKLLQKSLINKITYDTWISDMRILEEA
ncbi:type IV pilus twitching motility protein PilT [Microbulbifer epialgicus]|uniref:Type IV pilus twitching motility protein PilT n=1 Tax=Microbulbifer epialgicus TaxID=393907 RepID=A0ABV4NUX1_9GAMM